MGECEVALLPWHDGIRKDSMVRVKHEEMWVQARVLTLSKPDRRKRTCSVVVEHTGEEKRVSLDDCVPHFVMGAAVAVILEDSSIWRQSVEGNATICSDMNEEGEYEVEISGAGEKVQFRVAAADLVPRMRIAVSQLVYRPNVSNVLVVPDSFDRYDAGATARLAECIVSTPADAAGKYEVTLQRWDDLLDKGDLVRVLHGSKWFHGRLLSSIPEGQDVCDLHVEEVGEERKISLEECMPYFVVGETVALGAGREQAGQRNGTVCADLDDEGRYEVEMDDTTRHRIPAKDLVRRMRVGSSRLLTRHSHPLNSLCHAEEEAHTVAGILGVNKEDVLTGEQATLMEVQRRMAASTGVIHLATHGFVDPQVGGRSGIALCGSSHDKAVLTAHAVASMEEKLQSPLVVLSACDTGRGEEVAEGVLGLARAFTIAGADAVIMSLWEVDDDATRRIMKLFYETWLGLEDDDGDQGESVLQPKMSVVEAWTQTIRSWLDIQADPEHHIRMRAYKLLGMEASEGEKLTKQELARECYRRYNRQKDNGSLAKELREMARDLQQRDLSHGKSKYHNPIFWAAFSVVAV
uniref:CHAT domain-containing protein n=1 Tax=Pinguiococcus pyrenoidosus TaxID=172671 RepID=A0A7R9U8Y2_9STRA